MKGTAAIMTIALAFVGVLFVAVLTFAVFLLFTAEAGSPVEPIARWATVAAAFLSLGSFVFFPLLLARFIDRVGAPPAGDCIPAPFKARAAARMVDDLLPLLPLAVVLRDRLAGVDVAAPPGGWPAVIAWIVATVLLSNGLLEVVAGASVGKFLAGIRVVSADGKRVSPRQVVIRNAARFVDNLLLFPAGILAMLDSPLRQRLGDRWAGTVVVKAR